MASKGMGKAKGAHYEREICVRLSLWVSELRREDVFWRSAMSGGRATVAAHSRRGREFSAQSGDITATHKLGHLLIDNFCIDTKNWADFDIGNTVYQRKTLFLELWTKIVADAVTAKKMPMGIFKQNHKPDLVVVNSAGAEWLRPGHKESAAFQPLAILPRLDAHVYLFRDLIVDVEFARLREAYDRTDSRPSSDQQEAGRVPLVRRRLPPESGNTAA